MPHAHLGRGVKRDAAATAGPAGSEAAEPPPRRPLQPPRPKSQEPETKPQDFNIGTPKRDDEAESISDNSSLNRETKDDEPANKEGVLQQVATAMAGISKSIELMTRRIELIEGQKRRVDDPDALQSIHSKDIDKPAKYDGKQWSVWKTDFLNFLERRDRRWTKLLKTIDERSIDPLTDDVKNLIGYEMELQRGTLMSDFTTQLYEYLKNYTSGEIQSRVVSGGKENSWETWRFLCDQGKSRRKIEVHEEYKKLMNPRTASLETLMTTITQWERDLLAYTVANNNKGLDEDTKKLCLESMCPEPLQDHLLDKFEQGMISTYDQYKQAVSTYVYRKTKKAKAGKKLNLLEGNGDAMGDEQEDTGTDMLCSTCGTGDGDWDPQIIALKQQAEAIAGQINALVKGKIDKSAKGHGKGKGAQAGGPAPMRIDHSQKDCYQCGELGHIAANCPKAGKGKGNGQKGGAAPKGNGKGKGKGKAGKGPGKGAWQPSLQSWRYMYPGPSPSQWTDWWRQASASNGDYKGKTNLFEQGQRLSHMPQQQQESAWDGDHWQEWPQQSSGQVLHSLFAHGNMYKLVQCGPKAKEIDAHPKPVTTQNRFNKLHVVEEADDVAEDPDDAHGKAKIKVPLESLIKPVSKNRQRKMARSSANSASSTTTTSSTCPDVTTTSPTSRSSTSPSLPSTDVKLPAAYYHLKQHQLPAAYYHLKQHATTSPSLTSSTSPTSPSISSASSPTSLATRYRDRFGNEFDAVRRSSDAISGVRGGLALPADEAEPAETPKRSERASTLTKSLEAKTERVGKIAEETAEMEKQKTERSKVLELLNFARQNHDDVIGKQGLRVLREMSQSEKLAPLMRKERPRAPNGWEVISAVVDSGATITAVHPEDGKEYKVEESAASRAGVTYDTAGSEDLPNLGEKKMAVLTTEGTLRGFHSQVAEVSSPLESVRQLLGSKHCVLFGLGENEEEHLIVNKLTGEVNRLRDDGINYLHDLLVVPPDEVANVQKSIDAGGSPFGGLGNAH